VIDNPVLILLAWTVGGLVALAGGFVWAELASRFPQVGGQYVYLQRAYHPVVGFLYGIALLFIINGGSLAAVSMLFGSYVDRSFLPLGPAGIRIAAGLALVVLTIVNMLGVRAGKVTNNILMTAKVAGMLALVGLAFGHGSAPASHFDASASTIAHGFSLHLLLTALVPILFAYGGWQSCGNIAGEIKDPARNLPRANVLGVIVVVFLYLSLNVAYLWVMTPAQVAGSTALAADMARMVAGDAGARFVAALIVVSSLGFLAVVILTGPRLYYAMAADGLLFERVGRLNPRFQTPIFALGLQACVSLALMTTNTYDQLLSYVVFADWLFFGLTAGALLIVRHRERHGGAGIDSALGEIASVPWHPVTTILFVTVAAGVVLNSFIAYPTQSLIGSAILAVAAAAFFAINR
jgi:APA family basic amino acid/polyamine antiporter